MQFNPLLGAPWPYATPANDAALWHPRMQTALAQAPAVGVRLHALRCTGIPLQWHPTGWHLEPDIGPHGGFTSLAKWQAIQSRWLVPHATLLKAWLQTLPTPAVPAGVHSSL